MHICKSDICIIKKKKNKCQVFLQKKPDLKLNKNTTGKKLQCSINYKSK